MDSATSHIKNVPPRLQIQLEDLSKEPGLRWRKLHVGGKGRFATATAVKIVDRNTLVCSTLLGRKMYLIRFDLESGCYSTLHVTSTQFQGQTSETDLMDVGEDGTLITSNCATGGIGQYRLDNGRITHVRDLPTGLDTFVHGVKFYRPNIIAAATTGNDRGVYLFNVTDTESKPLESILCIPMADKTKDVCFLSENRLAMVTMAGVPTIKERDMYNSDLWLADFNLETRTFEIVRRATFTNAQFDCCVFHDGIIYINEQFTNRILAIDPLTLKLAAEYTGYDFPHGIDIRYDLMAVSNYGNNSIDIRSLE